MPDATAPPSIQPTDAPPTYPNRMGLVLGFLLPGSAHFLAGARTKGVIWLFVILLLPLFAIKLLATPGTIPLVVGLVLLPASETTPKTATTADALAPCPAAASSGK